MTAFATGMVMACVVTVVMIMTMAVIMVVIVMVTVIVFFENLAPQQIQSKQHHQKITGYFKKPGKISGLYPGAS